MYRCLYCFLCFVFIILLSACNEKTKLEEGKFFQANSLTRNNIDADTIIDKNYLTVPVNYIGLSVSDTSLYNLKKSNKQLDKEIEFETDIINHEIELQKLAIHNQKLIITLIIVLFVLILFSFYSYFKSRERKSKLRKSEYETRVSSMLIEAGQVERARVAGYLHDSVNQKLAVIQMYLSTIQGEDEKLKVIGNLINESINDVRNITHSLYASELENGLIPALTQLYQQNNFVNPNVKFELIIDRDIKLIKLKKTTSLVIFRLTQEVTNNALKHAHATKLIIQLSLENQYIILNIKDNGVGFDVRSKDTFEGIGLKNLINRIKKINGLVSLTSNATNGTEYIIRIPL